ncbi:epoxyqueuosine reductase QueH [bacterium]|nr:epoxyqueuosine reductase QueH [bacterium]
MLKVFLHSCCAPCSAYVIQELQKEYEVTLFYFNPNIFPKEEYQKRFQEAQKYLKKIKVDLIEGKYDHNLWLEQVKGYEQEPERGKRCYICYQMRLEKTAKKAKELGFDIFCSTLSISPHKDAEMINQIGLELAEKYNIKYLESDWKKQEGFKKACDISREEGFYRQSYCGCEFSMKH